MRSRLVVVWLALSGLAVGLLVVLALGVSVLAALVVRYPCWRYSNAGWCGHFCDDDPCACPERASAPDPYGAGPGCAP